MDKYLLEILKHANTIIIPGLGALTITNHATGEIMFMPYLKHDDGKLSAYIAENDGLDETEAKNLIAKYVREITAKLDQGDSYDMFQFGSFKKDASGDVEFTNWVASETIEPEPEVVKETPVVVETAVVVPEPEVKVEEVPEPVVAETPVPEVVEEIAPVATEVKIEEETPIEQVDVPKVLVVVESKEEITKVIPEEKKTAKILNIAEKEEIQKNQQKLKDLKEKKEAGVPRKKKGAGFYMMLGLLLVMVAGGVYVGMNFNDIKQHIPFLAENSDSTDVHSELNEMKDIMGLTEDENENEVEEKKPIKETPPAETIIEPTQEAPEKKVQTEVVKPKPVVKKVVTPKVVPTPTSGEYHIIVGAFSSDANANRLGEKLQNLGYPATVKMNGPMHLVSIKSFNTNEEAVSGLSELKSIAPNAWILHSIN